MHSAVSLMGARMEASLCAALKACKCQACAMTRIRACISEAETPARRVQSIETCFWAEEWMDNWSRAISSSWYPLRCPPCPPTSLLVSHSDMPAIALFLHRDHSESSCGWQLFHTVLSADINKSAGLNLTLCWANLKKVVVDFRGMVSQRTVCTVHWRDIPAHPTQFATEGIHSVI